MWKSQEQQNRNDQAKIGARVLFRMFDRLLLLLLFFSVSMVAKAGPLDDALVNYQAIRASYLQSITNEANLRANILAALGGEASPTNLPPDRLQIYLQAQSALNDFYGGRTASEFYAPIISQLNLALSQVAALVGRQVVHEVKAPAFFAVLNDSGQVVLRGETTADGVIPQMILPPNRSFTLHRYAPTVGLVYEQHFVTGPVGSKRSITFSPLDSRYLPRGADSDGDGLDDVTERILGTNPNSRDTDGDGIPDGAEVQQGSNPVDGKPVATGVIASVDTPGTAMDVYAESGLAVVADGGTGVILFSTVNSANPVRVAQVDTPGNAIRVAGSGNLVAVADGAAGLAVVDVSTPSQAGIIRQINLGGSAQAVAVAANIAYVGTISGQLIAVDMASGTVLQRLNIGAAIEDLGIGKEILYVLTASTLYSVPLNHTKLQIAYSTPSPTFQSGNRRLFVGDLYLYAVQNTGVNTFSLANSLQPLLLNAANTTQRGWKQFVPTGSRYAIAADDPNFALDGPNDVSLYDLSNPTNTQSFVTRFPTPGIAYAVSIYNGLAYVADGASGLQVINYLAYDTGTNPPTISLASSFPQNPATVEEGKIARVTAQVTDDVQVRNVEFYIDGQLVAKDGNFPFEYRFVTPMRASGRNSFTVQARAFDTGGNATWSTLLTVGLVADATPPEVAGTFPANAAILGALSLVSATFNEPINPATLNSNSFRVALVGPDGLPGTVDDVPVSGGTISYNGDAKLATLTFPTNLAAGAYAIIVKPPVADLASNVVATTFVSRFWITGGVDTDQDGIPDDIEPLLGLNPTNPDSNGNGIWDGDEDSDGDGLRNSWEILWGFNPLLADSNSDSVADGAEDADQDGLTNLREQTAGTNPSVADTDGDGWNDETEISGGSDPLNPASKPKLFFVGSPSAGLAIPVIPVPVANDYLLAGGVIATPSVSVAVPVIPSDSAGLELVFGSVVANPAASLAVPVISSGSAGLEVARGTVIANPAAALAIPLIPELDGVITLDYGSVIAAPPAQVQINTP